MARVVRGVGAVTATVFVVGLAACAGPATFVSATPPADADATTTFRSGPPDVREAIIRAMAEERVAVDHDASTRTRVVGRKHQIPYVGDDSTGPAPGALPWHAVEFELAQDGGTLVAASARAVCPSCDGAVLYVWERPDDLLRRILRTTERMLDE